LDRVRDAVMNVGAAQTDRHPLWDTSIMAFYHLEGGKAKPIWPKPGQLREKYVQSVIEDNLETIFEVRFEKKEGSLCGMHALLGLCL
jgi:hypothetical protein